jgi:hypothetical protein
VKVAIDEATAFTLFGTVVTAEQVGVDEGMNNNAPSAHTPLSHAEGEKGNLVSRIDGLGGGRRIGLRVI